MFNAQMPCGLALRDMPLVQNPIDCQYGALRFPFWLCFEHDASGDFILKGREPLAEESTIPVAMWPKARLLEVLVHR
ncbi:MAG: hypothetical protein ACLPY2_27895 [Bryobacteraceae bacterium]|jgi:hypothetical protein